MHLTARHPSKATPKTVICRRLIKKLSLIGSMPSFSTPAAAMDIRTAHARQGEPVLNRQLPHCPSQQEKYQQATADSRQKMPGQGGDSDGDHTR